MLPVSFFGQPHDRILMWSQNNADISLILEPVHVNLYILSFIVIQPYYLSESKIFVIQENWH